MGLGRPGETNTLEELEELEGESVGQVETIEGVELELVRSAREELGLLELELRASCVRLSARGAIELGRRLERLGRKLELVELGLLVAGVRNDPL